MGKLDKRLEQQKTLLEIYKACYRAKHNDTKDRFIRLEAGCLCVLPPEYMVDGMIKSSE
jgi:hypothetical protein